MKYVLILGDGMADYPLSQLDNKTPLQYAKKPNIDYLAQNAEVGMVKTIPDAFRREVMLQTFLSWVTIQRFIIPDVRPLKR